MLLTASIYTPRYGVLDRMSIQFFSLSAVSFLTLITLPLIKKDINFKDLIKVPLILCFLGYLFFCVLSITKSLNINSSLVRLGHLITFCISLSLLIYLVKEKLIRINHVLLIVLLTLIIDLSFSFQQYFKITSIPGIEWGYDYNYLLAGLHGNRNIVAASIAMRIPLIIILATRIKNNIFKGLIFLILVLSFLDIFMLSSRATLLSMIICILLFIIVSIYVYSKKTNNYFKENRLILLMYLMPCFIAYLLSTNVIASDDQANVTSRVSSIVTSTNDSSINTRLRYYSHALNHISKNPLLGAGIGNWKIYSIKYDKNNIQNYIIPYNAHNDILEATAETGFLGGILFTSFFGFLFYYIFQMLKNALVNIKNVNFYLILSFPFISYFIDLNLNFPTSRPFSLYILIMYISVVLFIRKNNYEKN